MKRIYVKPESETTTLAGQIHLLAESGLILETGGEVGRHGNARQNSWFPDTEEGTGGNGKRNSLWE